MRYACSEFVDIGPFRFECSGHIYNDTELVNVARRHHQGRITHHCVSPGDPGDVDVTFWTTCGAGEQTT